MCFCHSLFFSQPVKDTNVIHCKSHDRNWFARANNKISSDIGVIVSILQNDRWTYLLSNQPQSIMEMQPFRIRMNNSFCKSVTCTASFTYMHCSDSRNTLASDTENREAQTGNKNSQIRLIKTYLPVWVNDHGELGWLISIGRASQRIVYKIYKFCFHFLQLVVIKWYFFYFCSIPFEERKNNNNAMRYCTLHLHTCQRKPSQYVRTQYVPIHWL